MRIRPFPALIPRLSALSEFTEFFDSLKTNFKARRELGYFEASEKESLYIYRITDPQRTYLGIFAAVDIAEYLEGNILEHERTLDAGEAVQEALLLEQGASIKPVLLTYPADEQISKFLEEVVSQGDPDFILHLESELHELWPLPKGPFQGKLQKLFSDNVQKAYIADGHHRISSLAKLYIAHSGPEAKNPFRYLFSAFFPTSQLEVHDFNRLLFLQTPAQGSVMWEALRSHCEVEILEGPARPRAKHELCMLHGHTWYRLNWKATFLSGFLQEDTILDCQMLDRGLIVDSLASWKIGEDYSLQYLAGPKGMKGLSKALGDAPHAFGFVLFPVPLSDVMALADAGRSLPPKSTWFEPRMMNGLLAMPLPGKEGA